MKLETRITNVLKEEKKFFPIKMSFSELNELFQDELKCDCLQIKNIAYKIMIPDFQRTQNTDKIESIKKLFQEEPEWFYYCTNPLQLCYLKTEDKLKILYIIDGQHRLKAGLSLFKEHDEKEINVVITKCNNYDDIEKRYKLFNVDNKDILFNKNDIIEIETKKKIYILKDILEKKQKKIFKHDSNICYSLDQFLNKLIDEQFIDERFTTCDEAYTFIMKRNDIFYENYYSNKDIKSFKADEQKLIKEQKIFTLSSNNFIDFLNYDEKYDEDFVFIHNIKKVKNNELKKKMSNILVIDEQITNDTINILQKTDKIKQNNESNKKILDILENEENDDEDDEDDKYNEEDKEEDEEFYDLVYDKVTKDKNKILNNVV